MLVFCDEFVLTDGIIWLENNPGLNYEEVNRYELKVMIISGAFAQESIVYINVIDENDPPKLRNVPQYISVTEDIANFSDVYVVSLYRK